MSFPLGQYQFRRDPAATWTANNTVLLSGEIGLEADTGKFKLGDGVTAWIGLPYASGPPGATGAASTVPGPKGDKGDQGNAGTTDYNALSNKPTIGTAAAHDVGYFDVAGAAAAAQAASLPLHSKADTAGAADTAVSLATGTDRTKLDGIVAGATVGADWNTNVSNKPTLGALAAKSSVNYSTTEVTNKPTIPAQLSDLNDDTTHRVVTDTEKSTWSGKQAALGFTAENVANKVAAFQVTPDDTHYPSEKLLKDSLDVLANVSYFAGTMNVNTGTLNTGDVTDLAALGGTDVNIQESSGADPLRVTFDFTGVARMSNFVFFGNYNGGSGHQVAVEIYNGSTWDILGLVGADTVKAWYSFPIFDAAAYINAGAVSARLRHVQTGYTQHTMILDYVELSFGGSSGSSNLAAASVSFTPTGNIAATNVGSALAELDNEKATTSHAATHVTGGTDVIAVAVAAGNAGLISGTDKAKLDGVASGATVGADWNTNVANKPTLGTAAANNTGDFDATGAASGAAAASLPLHSKADTAGAADTAVTLATGADRTKLDGIAAGATVGADWNTNVANKPTLGTAAAHNIGDFDASGAAAAAQAASLPLHSKADTAAAADTAVTLATGSDRTKLDAAVPTSRSLTINGTAQDLSADRSWTVTGGTGISLGQSIACSQCFY